MSTTITNPTTTNPKRTPIPVVPMTMKIVNPDGTPTRSGQLLLEQLQSVLAKDMSGGPPGTGGGGGGGGGQTFVTEVPAGTMDGINTVFTLSAAPTVGLLFLNGVEQLPGTDFTLSGNTITYAVAPKSADWHMAFYSSDSSSGGGGGGTATNVWPIRTTAISLTMTNSDYTVVATAASITITLPPTPATGQLHNVKNGNSTVGMLITVTSGSSANIDTATSLNIGATSSLTVQWDGAQWRIL